MFRRIVLICACIWFSVSAQAICPCGAQQDVDSVERRLVVARYQTANLNNSEADSILNDVTNILRDNDGDGDFPADIRLRRAGDVRVFSDGDGSIDSNAEFQHVNSLSGNVKVVNEINWCGGPNPTAIGCAPVPGSSMVVERFSSLQEGILWAHEYGHNCNLHHRDVQHVVMRSFIGATHRRINETERDHYLQQIAAQAVVPGPNDPQPVDGGQVENPNNVEKVPVEVFVQRTYFHGIPWDEASKYGKDEIPKLLKMLNDKEFAEHKANIVATLGLIGDDRAIRPLQELIESGEGRLSATEYKARRTAVFHLGTLYANTKNKELLEYLRNSASSTEFLNKTIAWTAPQASNANQRNKQIVTMAIWGLGVSGTPEGRETLELLSHGGGPFEAATDPIVDEALKINAQVQSKGLINYYQTRSQK